MDGGKKVWVPDNEHGFRLGEIVDLGSDTITVEVDNSKGKVCETLLFCTVHWENVTSLKIIKVANICALFCQVVTAAYDRVFPSEKDNTRDFEDNCELKFVKPLDKYYAQFYLNSIESQKMNIKKYHLYLKLQIIYMGLIPSSVDFYRN